MHLMRLFHQLSSKARRWRLLDLLSDSRYHRHGLLSAPAYNFKWLGNGHLIKKNGRFLAIGNLETETECQSAVEKTHGALSKLLKARKKTGA